MNEPAPIPTRYNGYLFRSRLEARWAVFFDALKIEYQYEPEGFQLAAGWYLPDFFLPQVKLYAEAKPLDPDPVALAKGHELCRRSGKGVLFLIGPPDFRVYPVLEFYKDGFLNDQTLLLDIDYHSRRYYLREHRFFGNPGTHLNGERDEFTPEYREAVFASRMARFESGK